MRQMTSAAYVRAASRDFHDNVCVHFTSHAASSGSTSGSRGRVIKSTHAQPTNGHRPFPVTWPVYDGQLCRVLSIVVCVHRMLIKQWTGALAAPRN